jgi:hypothetical protein
MVELFIVELISITQKAKLTRINSTYPRIFHADFLHWTHGKKTDAFLGVWIPGNSAPLLFCNF